MQLIPGTILRYCLQTYSEKVENVHNCRVFRISLFFGWQAFIDIIDIVRHYLVTTWSHICILNRKALGIEPASGHYNFNTGVGA